MTGDHRRAADGYWNHNTAYHPWLARHVRALGGDVLDVGCGDGLLLRRLAPLVRTAVGVECDVRSAERAEERLRDVTNTRVLRAEFLSAELAERSFDAAVFVASLHHMDAAAALAKAKRLLRPGGQLLVVGLARNASPSDWAFSALTLPLTWLGSRLHRELREPGYAVAEPRESLRDLRRIARELLPGASLRRALHFRYLLRWVAPDA